MMMRITTFRLNEILWYDFIVLREVHVESKKKDEFVWMFSMIKHLKF